MSLVLTTLTEAAIRARGIFEQFEGRFSNYGVLKPFMDGASALLPRDQVEAIKNASNERSVVFPVLTKQTLTVLTARSCAITGQTATSAKPVIPKITRGFEMTLYPKVNENNYISETDEMANQWANGIRSIAPALDIYAAGVLETKKNTALATVNLPGVNIVGNAYQIDQAYKDSLYTYIRVMLEKNDINGGVLQNVANTEALDTILRYESRGANNSDNIKSILEGTAPSAIGNFRHYRSSRITPNAGVVETHYIVPFGSVGVFTWNDSDAIAQRTGPNGAKSYVFYDPIMGIRWDVYAEPICSDLSGAFGTSFVRTLGTRYQIAADFGFFSAFSSDSSSPIVKVELLQAA